MRRTETTLQAHNLTQIPTVIGFGDEWKSYTDIAKIPASISVFDRGYLYGDGVYEVARTYRGKYFALADHLYRLAKSAQMIHMELRTPLPVFAENFEKAKEIFYREFKNHYQGKLPDLKVRLVVSRGSGTIDFIRENVFAPETCFIIAQPFFEATPEQWEKGLHLGVVDRIRNSPQALEPSIKSGNYLNNVLALIEAKKQGFDEALLCNHEGFIAEGTVFSFYYVKNNIFVTSPLEIGILDSITRRITLKLAKKIGMETREVYFTKNRLYDADEVGWLSTTRDVHPVTQVDHHVIASGKPGPWTRKLKAAFAEWVQRS